jgi:tripartite-type tricarboxylate transporter receptor subunit TctC
MQTKFQKMTPNAVSRRKALAALAVMAASGPLWAAQWPEKTVTLVVPTVAGSAPDTYARALAEQMGRTTGVTFIVDNKPAASGNVGAEAVVRAAPDGYTLLVGTQALNTINPTTFSQLRWKPENLTPLVKGVEAPLVLVAHPSVPARDFAELVPWLQSQRGKLAYASFSAGTPSHFLGYMLNDRLKAEMVHVPYKGSAPQINDLLGGQVKLGFTQLATSEPHIRAGKLKAFAVTSTKRVRSLSQVPTAAELGYPELTSSVWFGLFVSSATPKPIQDLILKAAVTAHADAGLRGKLEAIGFEMADESGPAFAKDIETETARWAGVVKATGFRALE